MMFSIFYEIPVARPWNVRSERDVLHEVLEQAIRACELGFHAVWSVEHHFLEEFSPCSNPEDVDGAIASRTEKIRIGYGVRLAPKPYNHPVRAAESVATLDLLSDGRVDVGTGRSTTCQELEGFGIDPHETREMWQEAVGHNVGSWTNDEYAFEGEHWSIPSRRVLPKPLHKPHPPIVGASQKTMENLVAFSDWLEARSGTLGTYEYTDRMRAAGRSGRAPQALIRHPTRQRHGTIQ